MSQPSTKHHAEWLSLLEISGPFLSMPVLTAAFPQGLETLDDGQARSLRADYEFWAESPDHPAVQTAWVRLVLESLLGYSAEVLLSGQAIASGWKADFPEHEETLRPDLMLVEPGGKTPHLLIQVYPPSQSLEKPVQGSRWQASVATRMMELLHATEVRLGLVTNGEQWLLVDAPRGETTGFISWYSELWFDEPITLRAFKSLLGVQRFFGVAEDQTLESLLKASANDQQEITDQLGLQVRHAVEILIQKIDLADRDSGGELLGAEVPPALLYEAALTVMMRLVFMLSAEERKLLPLDDRLYAENYAVSTLYAQLEVTEEEVLERRYDAWSRLLAVFRVVYHGIRHERLNLPPYGSSLFDPEKYPFLEGRTTKDAGPRPQAVPLPVNNRTVLHLLKALQILQVEGEARRISFRALDVEQIGHVYEGLLDHIAVRATELVVGLRGAKRQEPEVALSALENAAKQKEADWLAWLKSETGRSESALRNALTLDLRPKEPETLSRLRATIGNEARLFARLAPFAGLLRADDFGAVVVILPGSVYVTSGTARRATGTHYTPRSLTEPVVQHTLEPLVYVGPAEGLPREQWRLRSPEELLALKICDMAMGSGGFLVQVVRYLAERLVEAWQLYGEDLTDGEASGIRIQFASTSETGLSDPLILARRLVAERCIYGVDKNPLAVEIAKLSLWLVTMAKDLPFSFLDHALKCGDSLVGCSEDDFLRWAHGYQASAMTLFDEQIRTQLELARAKRRELESFVVNDAQDSARKAGLLKEAEAAMAHVWRGADLLTGARLLGLKAQEIEDLQINMLFPYMQGLLDSEIHPAKHPDAARALHAAQKERAFHWEFAFPEVFDKGGFDVFVGNPPFMWSLRISIRISNEYSNFLRETWKHAKKNTDLCGFFVLRGARLLKKDSVLGFITTNTIAEADTRETSLDYLIERGYSIFRAESNVSWPGVASVHVAILYLKNGLWHGKSYLDGTLVENISPALKPLASERKPNILNTNQGRCFKGSVPLGDGFLISEDEANLLVAKDVRNRNVIFPYIIGQELNSSPTMAPGRHVIYFRDWSLEECKDYPLCLDIIRERVKPERDKIVPTNSMARQRRDLWWKFTGPTVELYDAIKSLELVIVDSAVSKHHIMALIPSNYVYSNALNVFAFQTKDIFSILQSTLHEIWAREHGSTLETRPRYNVTDCFETFPFPQNLFGLEQIGETYHEMRREIMLARQEGLTKIYNRFHDPAETSADIIRLRELHVEMDTAVAAAYGWGDLALGHDFHETAQGTRYTISEFARREVLSRLLKLNHERWEEEQLQGAGEVKIKKGEKKTKKVGEEPGQYGLF